LLKNSTNLVKKTDGENRREGQNAIINYNQFVLSN
jgi:hypothetical protein